MWDLCAPKANEPKNDSELMLTDIFVSLVGTFKIVGIEIQASASPETRSRCQTPGGLVCPRIYESNMTG